MREKVLREVAARAGRDPGFLRGMREDPEGTLARYGYNLTGGELGLVEGLKDRTAGMSDAELAAALADGLRGRRGTAPARPATPGPRAGRPGEPARPGGLDRRKREG